MRRIDFLRKSVRLMSLGVMTPFLNACAKDNPEPNTTTSSTDCVASPAETAGPYPYDLSAVSKIFRKDIAEDKTGTPLGLTFSVVNVNNNCAPIENARVDIWHIDKDGYYSEYSEPGYLGTQNHVGETFLRGIQVTDAEGKVNFTTIYPGWYSGRIAHIHIEIFVNSVRKATTQMAFPDAVNQEVYNTSLYSAHGQNSSVASNAADMVFGDSATDLEHELCAITPNSATGGYDATLTVRVSL